MIRTLMIRAELSPASARRWSQYRQRQKQLIYLWIPNRDRRVKLVQSVGRWCYNNGQRRTVLLTRFKTLKMTLWSVWLWLFLIMTSSINWLNPTLSVYAWLWLLKQSNRTSVYSALDLKRGSFLISTLLSRHLTIINKCICE